MFILKRAVSLTSFVQDSRKSESRPNTERPKNLERCDSTPQRAKFLWMKIVATTRDIGVPENMSAIKDNQWQIALNHYHISMEPGLASQIFQFLRGGEQGKTLPRERFVRIVRSLLQDQTTFQTRYNMPTEVVAELEEDSLKDVLFAKIVHALMEGIPLDVFELLKPQFRIHESMPVSHLMEQMNEVEWQNRIEIMEHIAHSDERELSHWDATLIFEAWATQFRDERSQLVRVALETCPLVLTRILDSGIAVDVSTLIDGLVAPIRAKRSKELQKWSHACGEKLMCVFLRHFRYNDEDSISASSTTSRFSNCSESSDYLIEVVNLLCGKIIENSKHERVRKAFLSYLVQIIAFYKEAYEVSRFFEVDGCRRIVDVLNLTLTDKKTEVRDEACRFMRLMDRIMEINPYPDVKSAIQGNVLSQIDVTARLRFERRKTKRGARTRARTRVDLRSIRVQHAVVEDAKSPSVEMPVRRSVSSSLF